MNNVAETTTSGTTANASAVAPLFASEAELEAMQTERRRTARMKRLAKYALTPAQEIERIHGLRREAYSHLARALVALADLEVREAEDPVLYRRNLGAIRDRIARARDDLHAMRDVVDALAVLTVPDAVGVGASNPDAR